MRASSKGCNAGVINEGKSGGRRGGSAARDDYAKHFAIKFGSYLCQFCVVAKRDTTLKVA